nr:MAG TPA: hypothetical protein [Caudoviricetes sp.]
MKILKNFLILIINQYKKLSKNGLEIFQIETTKLSQNFKQLLTQPFGKSIYINFSKILD